MPTTRSSRTVIGAAARSVSSVKIGSHFQAPRVASVTPRLLALLEDCASQRAVRMQSTASGPSAVSEALIYTTESRALALNSRMLESA